MQRRPFIKRFETRDHGDVKHLERRICETTRGDFSSLCKSLLHHFFLTRVTIRTLPLSLYSPTIAGFSSQNLTDLEELQLSVVPSKAIKLNSYEDSDKIGSFDTKLEEKRDVSRDTSTDNTKVRTGGNSVREGEGVYRN